MTATLAVFVAGLAVGALSLLAPPSTIAGPPTIPTATGPLPTGSATPSVVPSPHSPLLSENRSASNYVVLQTLDLLNRSLVSGNLVNPVQCSDPSGVTFDPTGTYLYVACSVTQNVLVVDVGTATVVRGIPVGSSPNAILYVPHVDAYYVVNEGSNNLSVFTANATVPRATIAVGGTPVSLAANASGTQVFVADSGSNSVAIINTSTNTTVRTVYAGFDPVGVVYDELQDDIVVTNTPIHNVTIVSAGTHHVVTTLAVGSGPAQMAYDGTSHQIYVANSLSDNVSVIDMNSITVTRTIALGVFPGALVDDPVAARLYVAEQSSSNVTVVNTTSTTTVGSIPINGFPSALAWDDPHGRLVATDSANTTADLINVSAGAVTSRILLAVPPGRIAYDAFTKEVYVSLPYATAVAVINASTGREWGTIEVGERPDGLGVDPLNGSVFVSSLGSYYPVLIAATNHTVIARPYMPGESLTATFDVPHQRWYVPLYDPQPLGFYLTGSVTEVVDAATLSDLKILGVGWCYTVPDGAFDLANGTFFQANAACANVTVYSTSTYQLLKVIGTGLSPSRIVYDAPLGEMFVANSGTNNVSVINATTYRVVDTIAVGLQPEGLGLDPSTGLLFVANSGSGDVMIINTTTDQVVHDITVGTTPFDIAVDTIDGTIYVTNSGSGTVSVLGPSPFTAVTTSPVKAETLLGATAVLGAQALGPIGAPLAGASYQWTVAPPWLGTLNSSVGTSVRFTAGSTIANGTAWVNVTYGPVRRGATVPLAVVAPALVVTPLTARPALLLVGGSTTFSLNASGGVPPYQYTYSGLPPGCPSSNAPSIPCTPSQAGVYSVVATVRDIAGQTATETLAFDVTTITQVQTSAPPPRLAVHGVAHLTASGYDGFGEPVPNATLRWTVVPSDLGTLNRTTGTAVTLTSTGFEASGTVWANGSYEGTTVAASIPINATVLPPSTPSTGLAVSPLDLGILGAIGAVAIVATAVVLRRRRGRGPDVTTDERHASLDRWPPEEPDGSFDPP
ncbi:MAG: hypothetical protein ACREDK_06010 [Thermoplasmata archaeon]